MTVFTIGHSTRTLGEFLELLRHHDVQLIVDVRRYPGSRRLPHFSREELGRALRSAGVGYEHELDLGGRRTPRPDSPNRAWRAASFRGYADHMATAEWQAALERVLARAGQERLALMCAEAVPWRCHRQLIADALVARGVTVRHIISGAVPAEHALHPAAVVGSGLAVRYPAPEAAQPELF